MDVFGVHLDRKSTLANVERITADIRRAAPDALLHVNAADAERRAETAAEMQRVLEERGETGTLRILLHSLAFGTLKPFLAVPVKEGVTQAQMDMTVDVMAHSLLYWTQELVGRGLMTRGGRIYAMTSSGSTRVLPRRTVSCRQGALGHTCASSPSSSPRRHHGQCDPRGVTATPAAQRFPATIASPTPRTAAPERAHDHHEYSRAARSSSSRFRHLLDTAT